MTFTTTRPPMKIVVTIKQVPERDAPVRIDASGRWIESVDAGSALNEPDAYALEEGLLLKEKHGGELIAVSIGPESAASTLREALAKGADRALHIVADTPQPIDALATARLLAAAIGPEQPDLVLTGLQSEDLGQGQTGVMLAELLGLPHATLVLSIEGTADGLQVTRELEDGWRQTVDLPLPAALTIQSGGAPLRYATLMGIKRAKTKELRTIAAASLAVDMSPAVELVDLAAPVRIKNTRIFSGPPHEAAAALVAILKNEVLAR
jgi:electron transfer flavoprotein beta subunit